MTSITLGGWMMVSAPVLLGAMFGLDSYRDTFFHRVVLYISMAIAGLVLLVGAEMYAPVGMVRWELPHITYFIVVLSFGLLAFVVCLIAWLMLLQILGRGLVLFRELAGR